MSSSRRSRLARLLLGRISGSSSAEPRSSLLASASTETSVLPTRTASAAAGVVADPCPRGLEVVAEDTDPVVELVLGLLYYFRKPYRRSARITDCIASLAALANRFSLTVSSPCMVSTATAKRPGLQATASTGSAISCHTISLRPASSAGATTPTPMPARASAANTSTTMHWPSWPTYVGNDSLRMCGKL